MGKQFSKGNKVFPTKKGHKNLEEHLDDILNDASVKTVTVPEQFSPIFKKAENVVSTFFKDIQWNPCKANMTLHDDRFILIRGPSITCELFRLITGLFGEQENDGIQFYRNLLFDLSHQIGKADSTNFNKKMNVTNPIEKLSGGPVLFSFTGWAAVSISADSTPIPEPSKYCLLFDHPFSFEADSFLKEYEKKAKKTMCIMSCGYSSGWCEESFGLPLVTFEILCRARGDSCCKFIMAHPDHIFEKIIEFKRNNPDIKDKLYVDEEIPGFFDRKIGKDDDSLQKELDIFKRQHNLLKAERQKVVNLLNNILPEKIATEMSEGKKIEASRKTCTIVFADIVDFTLNTSFIEPNAVVQWLDKIFLIIDNLTEKHKVEKIKTIGDCYMAVCGVPKENHDHLETALRFAIDIIKEVKKVQYPLNKKSVQFRIGIDTGEIVAGVIGNKKFLYDVWGDPVNVASRMESTGLPGRIQVTEKVYDETKLTYDYEKREQIYIKGKGMMQTYLLSGEKEKKLL